MQLSSVDGERANGGYRKEDTNETLRRTRRGESNTTRPFFVYFFPSVESHAFPVDCVQVDGGDDKRESDYL